MCRGKYRWDLLFLPLRRQQPKGQIKLNLYLCPIYYPAAIIVLLKKPWKRQRKKLPILTANLFRGILVLFPTIHLAMVSHIKGLFVMNGTTNVVFDTCAIILNAVLLTNDKHLLTLSLPDFRVQNIY